MTLEARIEAHKIALAAIAERLVWWRPPESALRDPLRFLAQVMTDGAWEDVQTTRELLGEQPFRMVLLNPPPGVFDARSWNSWHHVLGVLPVPPLPQRRL